MTDLPVIGAAMMLDELETHRDWVIAHQRDLEIQNFFDAEVLSGDWSQLVAQTKKLLDGYTGRLGIHGPFWGFAIGSQDPEIRAVVAKRLHQGLNVCAALGATQMVVHSPFTTWSYTHPGDYDGMIERSVLNLQEAVKQAGDIGCTMVLENIEDRDPALRVTLAEAFNSSAVAVSIDTGHAHLAHGQHHAPPVDHYVRAAGNMLQHVHLQDADGYADRHWALGEGTILWPSVFQALAKLTSQPRLIIEIKDKSKIPASAAHLAALGLGQ